ncbi:BrnA antitoxin family protein [Inquilinus limosus]|uniref:BrnA antitoxin family protein n=1 Tax=Inquilinus limosus TaxID=171674 RepID=UPI003F15A1BE
MAKHRVRDLTDAEDAAIQRGIDADPDTVELTEEMVVRMRPAAEAAPEIVAAYRRTRGPQKAPTKQLVSLRLDREVLERFRAKGPGWQRLINDALRKAVGL